MNAGVDVDMDIIISIIDSLSTERKSLHLSLKYELYTGAKHPMLTFECDVSQPFKR